jgi:LmbE family N-acetylglucosaminyl deacetylase
MMLDLKQSALVVAHPDDEILWFSSLVEKAGRIVICYGPVNHIPQRAEQRRRVLKSFPRDSVTFLDLPEPGPVSGDLETAARESLQTRLSTCLTDVSSVFTHSPWGEYGHADHRRLNGVVKDLQRQLGYSVYVPSYVARHRLEEMNKALEEGVTEIFTASVDRPVVRSIFDLYVQEGCWTWAMRWRWPKRESFLRLGEGEPLRAVPLPIHVFDVKF